MIDTRESESRPILRFTQHRISLENNLTVAQRPSRLYRIEQFCSNISRHKFRPKNALRDGWKGAAPSHPTNEWGIKQINLHGPRSYGSSWAGLVPSRALGSLNQLKKCYLARCCANSVLSKFAFTTEVAKLWTRKEGSEKSCCQRGHK